MALHSNSTPLHTPMKLQPAPTAGNKPRWASSPLPTSNSTLSTRFRVRPHALSPTHLSIISIFLITLSIFLLITNSVTITINDKTYHYFATNSVRWFSSKVINVWDQRSKLWVFTTDTIFQLNIKVKNCNTHLFLNHIVGRKKPVPLTINCWRSTPTNRIHFPMCIIIVYYMKISMPAPV